MKKIFKIFCNLNAIVIFCSFLSFLAGNDIPKEEKMVYQVSNSLFKGWKCRYGLGSRSVGLAGPNFFYDNISLNLDYPYILTRDQGRALLVTCMQEALQAFNSVPYLRKYAKNKRFTEEEITINIFIKPRNKGNIVKVFHPEIKIFTFDGNTLEYKTDTPETYNSLPYYTRETETHVEALEILAKQHAMKIH